MRRLVHCAACERKYDASECRAGDRFHCHCGEVLVVDEPRGHDAAVVRCSSCGGPREDGVNRCRFCDADFTIHERDLHTVCPRCLARVSDRAKFCQHCATPLNAQSIAQRDSQFHCPTCDDRKLYSRRLGLAEVNVLECLHCAGIWLSTEEFVRLQDKVIQQPHAKAVGGLKGSNGTYTPPEQSGRRYRKCPDCRQLMVRQQYGQGSGVILDRCRQHGVWFDDKELQQVIRYLAEGGSPHRRKLEEPETGADRKVSWADLLEGEADEASNPPWSRRGSRQRDLGDDLRDVVRAALEFFFT